MPCTLRHAAARVSGIEIFCSRIGNVDLRKSNEMSQIPTPSHADAADVRPCLPLMSTPVELNERYRRVQQRRSISIVGKLQVVHQSAIFTMEV